MHDCMCCHSSTQRYPYSRTVSKADSKTDIIQVFSNMQTARILMEKSASKFNYRPNLLTSFWTNKTLTVTFYFQIMFYFPTPVILWSSSFQNGSHTCQLLNETIRLIKLYRQIFFKCQCCFQLPNGSICNITNSKLTTSYLKILVLSHFTVPFIRKYHTESAVGIGEICCQMCTFCHLKLWQLWLGH